MAITASFEDVQRFQGAPFTALPCMVVNIML